MIPAQGCKIPKAAGKLPLFSDFVCRKSSDHNPLPFKCVTKDVTEIIILEHISTVNLSTLLGQFSEMGRVKKALDKLEGTNYNAYISDIYH